MLSLQKENIFFSLFTPQFFIQKKLISILHVKWTRMNKGNKVENLKFWVNTLFEWSQSLFAATKIYILIEFPNGKYFSQFIYKFFKF